MGRLDGGASVPCIDSASFRLANEWLIFCPQMYGNASRERHFLIFADIGTSHVSIETQYRLVQRLTMQRPGMSAQGMR